MNRIPSLSNKWVVMTLAQVGFLYPSIMCDYVSASATSVLDSLQSSGAEGKLKSLESKEMHGCFFANDKYDCPWTYREWSRVLDVVIGLASDPDPRIRESVARYMSISTDARVVEPLGHMLADPDLGVRRAAVRAYLTIKLGDHEVHILQRIERLLEDEWPSVRSGAAAALASNGTHQSLEKLKKAYHRETDQGTKAIMEEAITALEK